MVSSRSMDVKMMVRRLVIVGFLAVVVSPVFAANATRPSQPIVILLLTFDLGWQDV